jgi:hypothetical protein
MFFLHKFLQLNEEDTHIIGQSDFLAKKMVKNVFPRDPQDFSQFISNYQRNSNNLAAVESLSIHLMQSLQSNDSLMIDNCLSLTVIILI